MKSPFQASKRNVIQLSDCKPAFLNSAGHSFSWRISRTPLKNAAPDADIFSTGSGDGGAFEPAIDKLLIKK